MSATTTAPLLRPLPQPRHASRIPTHLSPEQVDRIRQAAYLLPQVVQPTDYQMEQSAEAEAHLDGLGLVLLQKAVGGQRPSRWIDPALMTEALQHLNTVGSGQSVRALMLERAHPVSDGAEMIGDARHQPTPSLARRKRAVWSRISSAFDAEMPR